MTEKSLITLAVLAALGLPQTVWADPAGRWIAGLGASYSTTPYVGADNNEIDLVPYVAYQTDRLHVGIDEISAEIYDENGLSVEVALTPRWGPSFPDTSLFSGLERDMTFEGGAAARYQAGGFYMSASARHDVLSVHDGFQTSFAIGTELETGSFEMDFSIGGTYRDKNLNGHLYGVAASEASSARTAYDPGGDWSPFAEVAVTYPITDTVALFAFAGIERHSARITDSPLVDKDQSSQIGVFVLTQF